MKVDPFPPIWAPPSAYETYAKSAREALEFIREYYWEKAGVDWDKLEREWKATQGRT